MSGARFAVECRDVDLAYGAEPVVHGLTLEVAAGELVALLGPSGSGKSTILSAIAGFIAVPRGEIRLAGRPVASRSIHVPPERRSVGVVFQHTALWPHLTALETVAYPLRRRGLRRGEATAEARLLLERLGVGALAERLPSELSGGEQQRVGLARAIARAPDLFLFDEPTAHLDTALRSALQEELAERRAASGGAALLATHDVGEALAAADRVALLRAGRLVQVGTPFEVYERPVDPWAARLTGPVSELAVIVLESRPGVAVLRIGDGTAVVESSAALPRGAATVAARADWATLGGQLSGRVRHAWYRGTHTDYRLQTAAGELSLREAGAPRAAAGEEVGWSLRRVWAVRVTRTALDDDPSTVSGRVPRGPGGLASGSDTGGTTLPVDPDSGQMPRESGGTPRSEPFSKGSAAAT